MEPPPPPHQRLINVENNNHYNHKVEPSYHPCAHQPSFRKKNNRKEDIEKKVIPQTSGLRIATLPNRLPHDTPNYLELRTAFMEKMILVEKWVLEMSGEEGSMVPMDDTQVDLDRVSIDRKISDDMNLMTSDRPCSPINFDDYPKLFNIEWDYDPCFHKGFLKSLKSVICDKVQIRKSVSTDDDERFIESKTSQKRAFETPQTHDSLNFNENSVGIKRKRGTNFSETQQTVYPTNEEIGSDCLQHPYLKYMRSIKRRKGNTMTALPAGGQDAAHQEQKAVSTSKAKHVADTKVHEIIDLTISPEPEQIVDAKLCLGATKNTKSTCSSSSSYVELIPTITPVGDVFEENHYSDKAYRDNPIEFHKNGGIGWTHLSTSGCMRGKTFAESKFTLETYFEIALGPCLIQGENNAKERFQDHADMKDFTGVGLMQAAK